MKKLVQFNELVFNHTVYIESPPEISTEFKNSQETFANNHGDYSPERCNGRKVQSQTFDLALNVDKRKFPCEDKNIVEQFVKANLYKKGRLWAVQGDLLIWAVAKVLSISEGYDEKRHFLTFNVSFYLEEGIWHIADSSSTYFDDYYQCEITECFDSLKRPLCSCSLCNIGLAPVKMCPPCHNKRMCDIPTDKLDSIIGNCGNNKKINYSCCDQTPTASAYSEYNSSTAYLEFDGQTAYETDDVVLEICGEFTDLVIDWNCKKSIIEGNNKGKTIVNAGLVKNECDYLDISKFHGVCSTTCNEAEGCDNNPMALETVGGGEGIVHWTVNSGKNTVLFYGFKEDDIQEIKVYVRGIVL